MREFRMPALGADMESGVLAQWLVKPGSAVSPGDIVCVVETQKGAIEVEIFEDGVIEEILVEPGTEVPVGQPLARLDGGPAAAQGAAPELKPMEPQAGRPADAQAAPRSPAAPAGPPPEPRARPARALVTPAARRRAAELDVDPETMTGTGIDGSVTLADVEVAARRPESVKRPPQELAPEARPARGFDKSAMRAAIAAAMQRSKREIPHYYLGQAIDFSAAQGWLEARNADLPPASRLMPAVLLLKAAALSLRAVPDLNGHFVDGAFRPGKDINVGWVVALRGGGLVAPAINGVDRLPLPDLMSALRDLVQRARAGGLRASELSSGTVTVTSLGERGADRVMGVIYPPQVAVIGFGRIASRPWVVDGQVVARPLVDASLAADHRVCDGRLGGLLLAAIDRHLQKPGEL